MRLYGLLISCLLSTGTLAADLVKIIELILNDRGEIGILLISDKFEQISS